MVIKHLKPALIAGAVLVFLSGCAATQVEIESLPEVALPDHWSVKQAQAPNGKAIDANWWTHFGSDELTTLVNEGNQNNLEIAAAMSRVQQAQAQALIAGVPLIPTVGLGVNTGQDIPIGAGAATTSASGMLQIGYEVDFWGKNKAALESAKATLRANLYDRETVALTVTTGIVSTYLQVLSLRDRLKIAKQNVANAERVLKLVEAQNRAGAASPLDLARQRSAVAGQKASIPDLEQQANEALIALAILLGKPPQQFTVNETGLSGIEMPAIAAGLPSELLSRRPDIRRSEARLMAANANVAAARAALFPSITLTGSAGAQSNALLSLFNGPTLLANISSSLLVPIFDAGKRKNERALAEAQKEELVYMYRSAVIGALSEVDKALGNIRSLEERYRLKSTEVEQAKAAFNLSEIRYRVGVEDLLILLDTQRTLSNAENELGLIKLQRLQATVTLYKALGGGWRDAETDRQAVSAPAPAPEALEIKPLPAP
jgi:multidrug efflux system outer membrane protein